MIYSFNNGLILGSPGRGKAFHPWNDLKPCQNCGKYCAWAVGKDGRDYYSGSPYKIRCLNCGFESSSHSQFISAKNEWNNGEKML